jgi:hypothetical protein
LVNEVLIAVRQAIEVAFDLVHDEPRLTRAAAGEGDDIAIDDMWSSAPDEGR